MAFFESLADVDRFAAELGPAFEPLVVFGSTRAYDRLSGLRSSAATSTADPTFVRVRHSVVKGRSKEYGKTARSRRDVPQTACAVAALDALAPRLETSLLLPAARAGTSTSATGGAANGRPGGRCRG